MIRQIGGRAELACVGGYYGAKAAAYMEAYGGGYDFCRFYAAQDENGLITGGALMFNAGLTVFGNVLEEELEGLIVICGPEAVECPPHIARKLVMSGYKRVKRTMFSIPADRAFNAEGFGKGLTIPVPLMRMAVIMNECFEGILPDMWYTDMSHRVRHGVSEAYLYRDSAAAAVDFVSGGEGYVSSVAVTPSARGKGYARDLLRYIAAELEKSNVRGFLWADEGSEGYYRKLGYKAVNYDIMFVKEN